MLVQSIRLHEIRIFIPFQEPFYIVSLPELNIWLANTFHVLKLYVQHFQQETYTIYTLLYTTALSRAPENGFKFSLGKRPRFPFDSRGNELNQYIPTTP